MKLWRFLLFPFAFIYGGITFFRNAMYNVKIFRASKFNLPLISIGNLSMGGTGKTPHTEYLIRLLQDQKKVFTLSRGFGRKEYGFIQASDQSSARQIGDEPFQYYRKFGTKIGVAVDANRVAGVIEICRMNPDTEVILLDDAFQHRAIYAGLSLLITPFDDPFFSDYIVPVGRLRESKRGKNRADVIVVSKCPPFELLDRAAIVKKINPTAEQHVFFSRIAYGPLVSLLNDSQLVPLIGRKLIVVSGIANPTPLINQLALENTILEHVKFSDHYDFKPADILAIHNLFDKFATEDALIITTEKDAMRLLNPNMKSQLGNYPWFYQEITVEIDQASVFNQLISAYVEKNS